MAAPPLFHPGKELPILLEAGHFVIINKPAGLAAHPGPQTRDSVESRLISQKRGGPWLVHRLDSDTAGCLLIARRKTALIAAQQAFAEHQVEKRYWALVRGRPQDDAGMLETALRRISTPEAGWRMLSEPLETFSAEEEESVQVPPGSASLAKRTSPRKGNQTRPRPTRSQRTEAGKPARTAWRVLASNGASDEATTLLELTLHTGRTHQARVHCAALGTPIFGDRIYGRSASSETLSPEAPLQLLARSLHVPVTLPAAENTPAAGKAEHVLQLDATAHDEIMDAFLKQHGLSQ